MKTFINWHKIKREVEEKENRIYFQPRNEKDFSVLKEKIKQLLT